MQIVIQDAALVFGSNYTVRDGAPKGIVLHHEAGNSDVECVHAYHRNVNGWAGIGYHFYVTKEGDVWRGRPENWLGAHTVGFNDRLGICAEGNFETDEMPAVQQAAVVRLIAYLKGVYGDLPVTRHRDHDATACPGKNYPFKEIAAGVAKAKEEVQENTSSVTADTATPSPQEEDLVLRFQKAAMADGVALPEYGADGLWGLETATAAGALVHIGMTGERVKLIQEIVGADVDGIFGNQTDEAVRAFQATCGLDVDGIVGIETWKALLEVAA